EVEVAGTHLRHEVRVDLVLEGDEQAFGGVVAGLIGPIERGELDARDVAEPDGQLDAGRWLPGRTGRRPARAGGDDERDQGDEGAGAETGHGFLLAGLGGRSHQRRPTSRRSARTTRT